MGLAYIGQVTKLMPIAKADRIESAEVFCGVGGRWTGVVKRGQFGLGDRAIVYLQDAVVQPSEELKFLEVSKWRVKMARFRGAPSECVITPVASDEPVGTDLTEALGIVKYVKVLPHNLAGDAIGPFPSFVPKTDEPNFQTAAELIEALRGKPWYARVKADGSSTTAYKYEGRFGVCSRSLELADSACAYWRVAKQYELAERLPEGLALQFNRGMWFGSVYGTWLDEVSGAASTVTADTLLNGVQVGARVPVGSSTLMLVAHYYDLVGGQGRRGIFWNCTTTSNACSNGNSTTGAAGAGVLKYDFNVLQLATQWNTTIAGLPFQAWGQYSKNLDPDDLNTAWAAGVLYGTAANYRTWEVGAMYQVVEADALFGQLVDSDFGAGNTDNRGFLLRAGYAPVRNWVFNATYFINDRNVDVGTKSSYDRLQLDMNLRF